MPLKTHLHNLRTYLILYGFDTTIRMDDLKKIKINSVGKQKENGRKTEGKRKENGK